MVSTYHHDGFAYIGVLFLVAAISLSLAVVTQNEDTQIKREKEQDWLFIGNQYQRAIESYYQQSPDGIKTLPTKLEDLLLDSRFIAPVRHLRKLYGDPLNHQQTWSLVKNPNAQIIGVYSQSQEPLLSKKNMPMVIEKVDLENFDSSNPRYVDIQFVFRPKQVTDDINTEPLSDNNNDNLKANDLE
jgi:type II secretory pathway pseudopilin PulG